MKEAIARELKIARMRCNTDINTVALYFNINKETLRRYEKNAYGLSVERLENLLDYYGVKKDIFFANVCEYMHAK